MEAVPHIRPLLLGWPSRQVRRMRVQVEKLRLRRLQCIDEEDLSSGCDGSLAGIDRLGGSVQIHHSVQDEDIHWLLETRDVVEHHALAVGAMSLEAVCHLLQPPVCHPSFHARDAQPAQRAEQLLLHVDIDWRRV